MATELGRALTLAHQDAQAELSRQVLADLVALWPLLEWADLASTYPAWLAEVTVLVQRQRLVSASLAGLYLTAFRRAEGVPGRIRTVLAGTAPVEQIATSMRVTSLATIKRLTSEGVLEKESMDVAFTRSSGDAQRIVSAAGRETISATVHEDEHALGWARIIHGKTCAFCALLATRGPVYKSRQTADFQAHGHCDCTAEPFYDAWDPQPDVKALQDLYARSTGGKSGKAALHAWAKAYNAR